MIYDEAGYLVSSRAVKTCELIERETEKLFRRLLGQGMTITEGRALMSYLEASVRVAAEMELMISRCK